MTRSKLLLASLSALSLLAAGCAVDDVADESTGDSEVGVGGVLEGSPEAAGVLAAANRSTFTELDVDARLTSTAAKSIVKYRDGADGIAGNADDRKFATLAELDAQPYVATTAIQQLLAYAIAQGLVPATQFPSCPGAPRFPTTGKLVMKGGTKTTFIRDCDAFGACSEWQKSGNDIPLVIDPYSPSNRHIDPSANAWLSAFPTKRLESTTSIYEEIELFLTQDDCYSYPTGYVTLDRATGRAKGFMHSRSRVYQGGWYDDWSDCNTPVRPVTLQLGTSCLALTDDDPATAYGRQTKNIVQLTW
jgi:hypothetical protein